MAEFLEFLKKDSKVQNEIPKTNEKYKNESFSTESKIFIQTKVHEQAIKILGYTIEDMDREK